MTLDGRAVLVVEDEPIIAFTLEDMLLESGARPILTESLDQAFAALAEPAQIDVAILDVNLHGRKSYPIADALLARGIPFVFASGYGDALHPDQFADVPTVAKPYALRELVGALTRAMG